MAASDATGVGTDVFAAAGALVRNGSIQSLGLPFLSSLCCFPPAVVFDRSGFGEFKKCENS
jgi:hypothetical protein